jgi:hypothetical protein
VRTPTFRLPGFLLLIGCLGIVGATIGWIVWLVSISATSLAAFADQLGASLGYLLVGLAWWQWTGSAQADGAAISAFVRGTRVLAFAALATSITYLANLYGNLRFLYFGPGQNSRLPHFRVQLASYAAEGLGFLIAAVAFWIAARNVRHTDAIPERSEVATGPLVGA